MSDTPRRSTRERREVVPYNAVESSPRTKPLPTNGAGQRLGDLGLWETCKDDDLIILHRVIIGRPGTKGERKSNLEDFKGFSPDTVASTIEAKFNSVTTQEMKALCRTLDLETGGTKPEIVKRVTEFLMKPSGKKSGGKKSSSPKAKPKRSTSSTKKKSSPKKGEGEAEEGEDQSSKEEESDNDDDDDGSDDASEGDSPKAKKSRKSAEKPKPKPKAKAAKPKASKRAKDDTEGGDTVSENKKSKKSSASSKTKEKELPTEADLKKLLTEMTTTEIEQLQVKAWLRQLESTHGLEDGDLKEFKDFVRTTAAQLLEEREAATSADTGVAQTKSSPQREASPQPSSPSKKQQQQQSQSKPKDDAAAASPAASPASPGKKKIVLSPSKKGDEVTSPKKKMSPSPSRASSPPPNNSAVNASEAALLDME